ncbi:MAG TPA: TraR/DksA C4-type zinc finger protein, partial [Rubrobacter sp.]|nr:TraR/DksA C4-type zinc finger protein [Rubrobacter sp.]
MFEGLQAQGEINRIIARDEVLDDEFIARQRARLEDIRRTLLRERAGIQEDERQWDEDGHYAPRDVEDVRAHILAEDLDAVLDRQLIKRLRSVERALEKIEEGTYGICDATGEQIPKGRLEAVP